MSTENVDVRVDARELRKVQQDVQGIANDLRDQNSASKSVASELEGRGLDARRRSREFGGPFSALRSAQQKVGTVPLIGGIAAGIMTIEKVQQVVLEMARGRSFGGVLKQQFSDFLNSVPVLGLLKQLSEEAARKETANMVREQEDRRQLGDLQARLQQDPDFRDQAARVAGREYRKSREYQRLLEDAQSRNPF